MGRSIEALSVIAVMLAAALVYSYVTLENQISSLKQSGHSYCALVNSDASKILAAVSDVTLTLHQTILSDTSSIATLNSTQPPGYQGMIAILNDEITRDAKLVSSFNDFTSTINEVSSQTFCSSVSHS